MCPQNMLPSNQIFTVFKLLLPLDTTSFQASAQDVEALPKQIEALQQ